MGIQRVILLLLIGSMGGRCVGSVSVHSGKLCTLQTVLSSGEGGTLQYMNMCVVCLCVCVCVHACMCVYGVHLCVVVTTSHSLNVLLSS